MADTIKSTSDTTKHGLVVINPDGSNIGIGSGGTSATDDADFTQGSSTGTPVMGVYESTPTNITDGDMGVAGLTQDRALRVNVDNAGSIGGGTQYTEGDTDATITGTALMMEGAGNTLVAAQGTAANGLEVDVTQVQGTVIVDGSGVTQPVSGTVTANLSATDNAVLDAIASATAATQAAVEGTLTVTGGGGGTEYTEDVATPNPIVGTATLMERDDALSTVTPIEGDWIAFRGTAEGALWTQDFNSDASLALLGTIDADTSALAGTDFATQTTLSAINTKITAVDTGAVVVASSALPSGAATAANQTTIIGHVDGIETLLGTIDADTGNIATNSSTIAGDTTSIDGKLIADASDDLDSGAGTDTVKVQGIAVAASGGHAVITGDTTNGLDVDVTRVSGTVTVDGSGVTQPVSGTVTANLGATDNAVLDNIDTNTDYGQVVGGGAEATALRVTIANDSTGVVSIDDNGGAITVDGTVTETNSAAILADTASMDTNLGTVAGAVSGTEMQVDVVGSLPAGTNAIGKLAANSGVDIGDVDVTSLTGSTVAHDGVDSGNPHKIGGRAQAPTAALEEVADNDRVDAAFDRQGRLATWMGYPVTSAAINTSTSGDNTIVAAQGAGKRIALIGCLIMSDGTTDVRWEDGASGTAKTGQMPLQAREGFVLPIGSQPWFVGTANTLLNLELTAAINVHGIASYVVMED